MKRHLPLLALPGLLAAVLATAPALAKLPPPSDEAKARAAETKAKADHTAKVDAYKLCQSMNKVAEHYYSESRKLDRKPRPPVETPACADPGPFVYTPPEAASAPAAAASAPAAATAAASAAAKKP